MDTATVANTIVEELQHKIADINLSDESWRLCSLQTSSVLWKNNR